jgi:hypothetical protein
MLAPLAAVEFRQDAFTFDNPCLGKHPACRVESGFVE